MRWVVGLLVGAVLVGGCNAGPPMPLVSASPSPDATGAGPGATESPLATPDPAAFHPLPPDLRLVPGPQDPSASMTASSAADAEPGVVRDFTLGHCGLGSPFDFDGSLWNPIAGRDARGDPIESEAEIGELIDPTEGEVVLLGSGQVHFRTPLGSIILFARHVGAKTFFLCA